MLKIYHNNRCKKSREGLEILEKSGRDFEVKEYLKEPMNESDLEQLVKKLDITPIQLVRKNEKVWKENYKDKDLSDRELITVMVKNPKLIERPVVETEKKAIIGRPPSNIEKLL